jgi:hypothetical protein
MVMTAAVISVSTEGLMAGMLCMTMPVLVWASLRGHFSHQGAIDYDQAAMLSTFGAAQSSQAVSSMRAASVAMAHKSEAA